MVTFVIQIFSPKVYEPMVCVGHNRNYETCYNKSWCLGVRVSKCPWLPNDLLTTLVSSLEKILQPLHLIYEKLQVEHLLVLRFEIFIIIFENFVNNIIIVEVTFILQYG